MLWTFVKAAAERRQVQGLPVNVAGVSSAIHDGIVLILLSHTADGSSTSTS